MKEKIPLSNLEEILTYLTNKYGVFQFYTKSVKVTYLGRLIEYDSKRFTIDFLDTTGRWSGQMKFRPGDIRTIEFDTDYINSLKLVLDSNNYKKNTTNNS